MTVLVTGASGFVGGVVARRLVASGERVLGLSRRDPGIEGVEPVQADLREPLDIDPAGITAIVHCAASVSFTDPLPEARAINVDGTRHVLELAERAPHLRRVVHVSTAYVAGRHEGVFREDDLDVGQDPRNAYERSKLEAERLVRASGLPVSTVRPSIIVGDSETGETASFNVLYAPLRAFARGLVEEVPANPDAPLDVVPVDHVADVILAALDHPQETTLHAVAGPRAIKVEDLAELAADAYDRPAPRFHGAAEVNGLDVYAPYFDVRCRFDDARADALGLRAPRLDAYFDRLVAYAEATRWGRVQRDVTRTVPTISNTIPAIRARLVST